MKRPVMALGAGTIVIALCGMPVAQADTADLGNSYTAAAKITRGVGLDVGVTTSGDIAGLFGYLSPVLDQVVDPVVSQLSQLSNKLTSDVAAGITGAGYTASASGVPLAPPAGGYPDCSTPDWSQGNCYGPIIPNIDDAPVVDVTDGSTRGYATTDTAGAYSGARSGGASLTVLGLDLGSLGVATSSVTCSHDGSCTHAASAANVALLGGALAVRTAEDGTIQVSIKGGSYTSASALGGSADVSGNGLVAAVRARGASLQLSVQLTLDQLLDGLGVADTLSVLSAADAGSTATLTLTLGSGGTSADAASTAWGLDVGIGLSVDLKISVAGLITAEISAKDATDNGNLVDIELAYTAATGPGTTTTGAQPQLT